MNVVNMKLELADYVLGAVKKALANDAQDKQLLSIKKADLKVLRFDSLTLMVMVRPADKPPRYFTVKLSEQRQP